MVPSTRNPPSRPWRSASSIPVRDAADWQTDRDTASRRIPIARAVPHVPWGPYRPKAFAGEIVPFGVTAFREGHDLIGVQVRLTSPSGDVSLHRLSALGDGFDRWSTTVAVLEQGVWTYRFEAFADDFATWEHAADLKIAAGVDAPLMRELGAQLFTRAAAEKSRPIADRRSLEAAAA